MFQPVEDDRTEYKMCVIRRRIDNGKKSGELVLETVADLGLLHTSYELRLLVGDGSGKTLQGPENVYVVIMSEIEKQGIRKRVLHRTDSRGIFGRGLDGPTPPQPVMSIVDHLRLYGSDTEGVFRKSPKQSTMRECKSEMERGLVPDYKKYGTHVLASVLKDYLRSIPGKILLSGNYDLWIKEVVDEEDHEKKDYLRSIPGKILLSGNYDLWIKEVVDEEDHEKKISACRNLLDLLPTSHWILLANVLKLLNKIANSPNSKMSASALSVCLAPSFLDTTSSIQSSDPLESGKKIPLLVEFLILNAVEVTPPGFSTDNAFPILNPIDYNANHLCSPVPTCSDDESSQRTPIIEEMGVNSPSLSVTRDDFLLPDRPTRFLDVIDEDDGYSDSELEVELVPRPYSCTSFQSETLRQQNESTPNMENIPQEKSLQLPKADERKQSDTPRSPCLKRIHFQRKQEQVQQRSCDLFKYDTHIDYKVEQQDEEKTTSKLDPPPRKESREEATQTSDCGLPRIGQCDYSAFNITTASHIVQVNPIEVFLVNSHQYELPDNLIQDDQSVPNSPLIRRENSGIDNTSRPIVKDMIRGDEPQKPTVHVHPFTSDRTSEEPILRTITERLQSLFDNPSFAECRSPDTRQDLSPPSRKPRFRHSFIDVDKPPCLSQKFGESFCSPTIVRRSIGNRTDHDDQIISSYKHQDLFSRQNTNKNSDQHIITERFSSYCIEPPTVADQFKKDFPTRRTDLTRSFSQRVDKNTTQRDVQRAGSVKSIRRNDPCVEFQLSVKSIRRNDPCVGMDSLEINWSVRQLKTLFQDSKAPSINTDYNIS
ncbi:RhoGAP domain protein [Dictyocaulus viviparus]|uniref:RhoGAP domain protein n=1 Tax=Dictyocaulus viviparus TaxID=29172 RepID=A0A0D8Y9A3_DICVI|nr:RhoGAP domain protein [Dictyocaulus viviparus]